MEHIEIEVKFYLKEADAIRRKLEALGAKGDGKIFERNYRYDDKNNGLLKKKSILRLRKDRKSILTLKSRPPQGNDNNFKIHKELEVEVSDFSLMNLIIESLGFQIVYPRFFLRNRYMKNGGKPIYIMIRFFVLIKCPMVLFWKLKAPGKI